MREQGRCALMAATDRSSTAGVAGVASGCLTGLCGLAGGRAANGGVQLSTRLAHKILLILFIVSCEGNILLDARQVNCYSFVVRMFVFTCDFLCVFSCVNLSGAVL